MSAAILSAIALAGGASTITVETGRAITGVVPPGGGLVVASRERDAFAPPPVEDAARAVQGAPGAATRESFASTRTATPAPVAGQVRFALTPLDAGRLLVVENGYDRPVSYRAFMLRDGRRVPTSVCRVMPGTRGVESWPYAFDAIEVAEVRFEAARTTAPRCG